MKLLVVVGLCMISFCAAAQVGRFEEPVDTIPIGGEIQENKLTQMEAQDDLKKSLIELRDSLGNISTADGVADKKKELDQVISGLGKTEHDPALMKKGYALLRELRPETTSPVLARPRR
jgi:hypothetical protein